MLKQTLLTASTLLQGLGGAHRVQWALAGVCDGCSTMYMEADHTYGKCYGRGRAGVCVGNWQGLGASSGV
mgnify:CR=1 FL=1